MNPHQQCSGQCLHAFIAQLVALDGQLSQAHHSTLDHTVLQAIMAEPEGKENQALIRHDPGQVRFSTSNYLYQSMRLSTFDYTQRSPPHQQRNGQCLHAFITKLVALDGQLRQALVLHQGLSQGLGSLNPDVVVTEGEAGQCYVGCQGLRQRLGACHINGVSAANEQSKQWSAAGQTAEKSACRCDSTEAGQCGVGCKGVREHLCACNIDGIAAAQK